MRARKLTRTREVFNVAVIVCSGNKLSKWATSSDDVRWCVCRLYAEMRPKNLLYDHAATSAAVTPVAFHLPDEPM